MIKSNYEKFDMLRGQNLPVEQYAITGSGPMGIRDLKIIGDIDIIVTDELWKVLESRFGVTDPNEIKKICFPGGEIEAFCQSSFDAKKLDSVVGRVSDRILHAEIIDDLPFEKMSNILYFKKQYMRDKDLNDIKLIEAWLSSH